MTTITKEQAQEIIDAADEVITALAGTNEDVHPDNSQEMIRLYDDLNDHYAPPEVVRELARIALVSLTAEPVAYNQVQRYMMKDIIVRKMGGNLAGEKLVMDDIHAVTMALIDAGFRAFPPAPVVPDDWVMVPKEPTQAMINAWLSEVADWRGHVAGYKAALAAAPKPQNVPQNIPENIPSGKSTLTPDGWISCSERMPAQDDWVLIYSKHGEYLAGQVQGEYVELNDGTLSWLGSALHWMLLPEPPQQEVNRG
ncbi:Eaa protein [Salmonella enterica subsp. enterica]|uniref:Eaa protein n=2 Tax=Salmonella enterica TaxID=28901 RepID=A0A379WBA6_SALET|nr:Eaa protein [Salmonella enterica subsp. enterica]